MKKAIVDILTQTSLKSVANTQYDTIVDLRLHSKEVKEGDVYIALKGTLVDGHRYIKDAIALGAKVIFAEYEIEEDFEGVDYYISKKLREELGIIAANYYGHPSKDMKVVGITGTNGKTTIATLLYQLFTSLGHKVGLVSTIEHFIGEERVDSTHTTPNAIVLQSLFAEMKAAGCSHVFMEVSSHAVDQSRIAGIEFDGGVFTNMSHDHLDYHETFANYIAAKKKFFDDLPEEAFAISNIDDKRGEVMLQNTAAKKLSYALQSTADYKGVILENQGLGLLMDINHREVHFLLNGLFNAYNLLAVYATGISLGVEEEELLRVMSVLKGAAGRFEMLYAPKTKIRVIVDYAHTPDALLNVLATIQQMQVNGKIITVVGTGGDRDKTKRPIMRKVATEYSDQVILTSDNPRTEDPATILSNMMEEVATEELKKIIQNIDRREAIKMAIQMAEEGDVVLIAGKGHENYQEINGVRHHFDDKEEAMEAIQLFDK